MTRNLLSLFRRFRQDEDGSSTIEFCILVPAFIGILISSVESGLMMVRNVMLERGVDLAVRDMRLGMPTPPTYDQMKQSICDHALIVQDCTDVVQLWLEPISTASWDLPTNPPPCIDVNSPIDPKTYTSFNDGGNNDLMLVQVCSLHDPIFPTTTWGMQMPVDSNGDYALVVRSAFVNEPSR